MSAATASAKKWMTAVSLHASISAAQKPVSVASQMEFFFSVCQPERISPSVAAIFPHVKTLNVFLAYSEVLGFLMYLEDTGRVEKLVAATRDLYRLVPAG